MRVLNYNVRGLRDDVAALCRIVRDAAPDIAIFQEIPRFWFWRKRAARFAAACGLVIVAGGSGRVRGNLIVARSAIPFFDSGVIQLPRTLGQHARAAVWARGEMNGHQFLVSGVHMGLTSIERIRHVHLLMEQLLHVGWLAEPPGASAKHTRTAPLILGGDFNEDASGGAWQYFATALHDEGARENAPTFSTSRPRRRIDAIFTDPSIRVSRYDVLVSQDALVASDHFPLLAELAI